MNILQAIKSVNAKLRWFIRNYSSIKYDSTLFNDYMGNPTYNTDGLTTSNNCDFIKEPRFASAYRAAFATNPWPGFTLQWRIHVVCFFAEIAAKLEGDFVECGVNTGAYAKAIIEYTNFNILDKKFYLLDTFEGLVEAQISENEIKQGINYYLSSYRDVYDEVKETFKNDNVILIKGIVPDTLNQCDATKIAYLSIDMNVVEPEIAAANYFWEKIVKGGVVILDDYGFPQHIEQKKAFDRFAEEKNINILCLPTGQGIMIKL